MKTIRVYKNSVFPLGGILMKYGWIEDLNVKILEHKTVEPLKKGAQSENLPWSLFHSYLSIATLYISSVSGPTFHAMLLHQPYEI